METELQGEKLQQAIREYIDIYCEKEKSMRPNTLREKRELFKRFVEFIENQSYNLENVTAFRLQLYKTWVKPNSQADLTRKLRAITKWLHERKYIPEDFSKKLEYPPLPKQRKPYLPPEKVVDAIIAGSTPGSGDNIRNKKIKIWMRLALFFMLLTGFRINEVQELKVGDLDFLDEPAMCYVHSKGGDIDQFPIPINMIPALQILIRGKRKDDVVFDVTEKSCNLVLKRGLQKCGFDIHITCHDLRSIFGTKLTKDGITAQLLQKAMRHANIETTMRYYIMLDITDVAKIINGQKLIVSSMQPKSKMEMYIESIKRILQDDASIEILFEQNESGFQLRVNSKTGTISKTPLQEALDNIV